MDVESSGIVPPYYLRNGQEWADVHDDIAVSDGELSVRRYERGVILPIRRCSDETIRALHTHLEGGVCDADGTFVAGHTGSTWALNCRKAYDFDESTVRCSQERVVFCGVLYCHFGHQLVDSMVHLWYLCGGIEPGLKPAFVVAPLFAASPGGTYRTILKALGVNLDDVVIVQEPTRFAEVVVPDQSFGIMSGGDPAGLEVFRRMRDGVVPGNVEKVYLSRARFGRNDCFNEAFMEQFYAQRGFAVVYPEKLRFEQQVATIAGAREVATTVGTLSHMATLFSRDDARITLFPRSVDVVRQQLVLDKLLGKRPVYVEAIRSPLPTAGNVDAHLFGPTRFFCSYLADADIAFTEEELGRLEPSDHDVVAFLRRYLVACEGAFDDRSKQFMQRFDMADVLASLREGLDGRPARREDFLELSVAEKLREQARREADAVVEMHECSYADGVLSLKLRSSHCAEEAPFRIVMVEQAKKMERAIAQTAELDEEGVACFELDVRGFFGERLRSEDCERWDLFLQAPDQYVHIRTRYGRWPYTMFSNFFLYEDGKLLVPHACGENGYLSLWFLGHLDSDFSEDYLNYRECRPLVSELLCRIIRRGAFEAVPQLYRDYERGRIRCIPWTSHTVTFRRKTYRVGYFAYLEACQYRTARKPPLLLRALRAIRRALRPVPPQPEDSEAAALRAEGADA